MKRLNKKGFTLIELLAVIVILAVVLGIAIPAVSQYITKSRKNGYVDNLLQFVDAARKGATLGETYSLPVDANTATVVKFSTLAKALEKGGKTSSYGYEWKTDGSYVIIVNDGTADDPQYTYYVTASDGKYITGSSDSTTPLIFSENSLKAANVVRKDNDGVSITSTTKFTASNGQLTIAATGGTISIQELK